MPSPKYLALMSIRSPYNAIGLTNELIRRSSGVSFCRVGRSRTAGGPNPGAQNFKISWVFEPNSGPPIYDIGPRLGHPTNEKRGTDRGPTPETSRENLPIHVPCLGSTHLRQQRLKLVKLAVAGIRSVQILKIARLVFYLSQNSHISYTTKFYRTPHLHIFPKQRPFLLQIVEHLLAIFLIHTKRCVRVHCSMRMRTRCRELNS